MQPESKGSHPSASPLPSADPSQVLVNAPVWKNRIRAGRGPQAPEKRSCGRPISVCLRPTLRYYPLSFVFAAGVNVIQDQGALARVA
jgi:hypothetical protein